MRNIHPLTMAPEEIIDHLRDGHILHIRYKRNEVGPRYACISEVGCVSIDNAIEATENPFVHECYDGDGKCFEHVGAI